jgi:hypothetical protein
MLIRHSNITLGLRSVNLIFYDLAGEDIADDISLSRFGWPVLEAHAFIYLADPFTMKMVRDRLPDDKKPNAKLFEKRSSNAVLDRALDVFRCYRRLAPGSSLQHPVAIMISKSDLLDDIIPAADRQDATYLDQMRYDGLVHVEDFERNHKALKKWLTSIQELGLQRSTLFVPNSSYFAVSATGSSANAAGKFASIQPRRCLDPLLWILWRFATGVF